MICLESKASNKKKPKNINRAEIGILIITSNSTIIESINSQLNKILKMINRGTNPILR